MPTKKTTSKGRPAGSSLPKFVFTGDPVDNPCNPESITMHGYTFKLFDKKGTAVSLDVAEKLKTHNHFTAV